MLTVNLFGHFEAQYDQQPLAFRSDKIRALLACLVLSAQQPQARASLATLLWGELRPERAYGNLRASLLRLRESLAPLLCQYPEALTISQHSVSFNLNECVTVDVLAFDGLMDRCDQHSHTQLTMCDECLVRMKQAVAIYRAPLLQQMSFGDSPTFDEWLTLQRQPRQHRALAALHTLALHALAQGDCALALQYAQQHVSLEPWREEGHRLAMLAWQQHGNLDAALAQYDHYCGLLNKELAAAPSTEMTALAQRLRALQLHSEASQPAQHGHNLPASLTSFIGRERDLRVLAARLHETTYRLVSLVGMGGVGKTRLALQLAHQVSHTALFPDGIWWCELSALRDPDHLVAHLVRVLGLLERRSQTGLALLKQHLKRRRALLIFDNCEHLIASCAQLIEALLLSCPHLTIMVTSREPLNLTGEWMWRLAPLAFPQVPTQGPPLAWDEIRNAEAVRLFVDRVMQADADFVLTPEDAGVVVEICARLDGIPLALELAAARVKALSVAQIAARLERRLTLLTQGQRTALPRQQTIRATLDWSHNLLSAAEQRLFRRLAVFTGGLTLEAAEMICNSADFVDDVSVAELGHLSTFDLLTRLVDRSLIIVDDRHSNPAHEDVVQPRYLMLETVCEYAREKLVESNEATLLHDRHLRYFVEWMEVVEQQITGPQAQKLLAQLEREYDNLRAALAWACQHDREAAHWLAGLLHWFWFHRDDFSESFAWYGRVLSLAAPFPTKGWAMALLGAGTLATFSHQFEAAQVYLDQSIAAWTQLGEGSRGRLAWAYYRLIYLLIQRGELQQACAICAEQEGLIRSANDILLLGLTLGWWAKCLIDLKGDLTVAKILLDESVQLGNALQDPRGLFAPHQILGYWAQAQGEYALACQHHLESLRWRRIWGTRWVIVAGLRDVAAALAQAGNTAQALMHCEEALVLVRALGNLHSEKEIAQRIADLAQV